MYPDSRTIPAMPTPLVQQASEYEPRKGKRPPSVTVAVRLMAGGGVVSFATMIAALSTSMGVTSYTTGQAAVTWTMLAAISTVVWMVMSWKVGRGRPLSRLYATALAVLNVLFTIGLFSGTSHAADMAIPAVSILSIGSACIGAAIVALLWAPTTGRFFDFD